MSTYDNVPGEDRPRPDVGELRQDDYPPVLAVAVDVQGIVNTQEVPATRHVARSVRVTNAVADAFQFAPDRRRKALTFWCEDQGIFFSQDRQGVTGTRPDGAHLPAGGSYTANHNGGIWVCGDNASSTLLSYVMEQWAD